MGVIRETVHLKPMLPNNCYGINTRAYVVEDEDCGYFKGLFRNISEQIYIAAPFGLIDTVYTSSNLIKKSSVLSTSYYL